MNPKETENLANDLIKKYTHSYYNYTFGFLSKYFIKKTKAIGACDRGKLKILLNKQFTSENNRYIVENTIKHEIAHVLSNSNSHGPNFVTACKKIGITDDKFIGAIYYG